MLRLTVTDGLRSSIESSYGEDAAQANKPGARQAQTVCAKFRSGVCFGVGFVLERACGPECDRCSGKPFDRQCRLFDFKPHYDVKLEWKDSVPEIKVSCPPSCSFLIIDIVL